MPIPITLENSELRLVIRPDLGARIDQIQDLQTQHNWLWHPTRYDPNQGRSLPIGASFDANWTGGWDEIFPNDAAGTFQGRQLVDHGELWAQSWQVESASALQVMLRCFCQTVPVTVTKTITLDPQAAQFHLEYQLQNRSDEAVPFLLKQHAAIAIDAGDEILLPHCLIEPVTLDFSTIIGKTEKTFFPKAYNAAGELIELQRIPAPDSQLQEFYYSSNLDKGECGIHNVQTRSSLIMRFETSDFPYVWVFQSYGGWQNHYVVVMEPCTTIPYDLEVAYHNGTTPQLLPRETQQRRLTIELQR